MPPELIIMIEEYQEAIGTTLLRLLSARSLPSFLYIFLAPRAYSLVQRSKLKAIIVMLRYL